MPRKIEKINRQIAMGAVIRSYRMKAGIGVQELADMMDVSRGTILHWETDLSRPTVEQIRELIEILGIPFTELFDIKTSLTPSVSELRLINQYRQASETGKHIIESMIRTVVTEEQNAHDRKLTREKHIISFEATQVAAGTGIAFSQAERGYCFVNHNELSDKADTIIRVSGMSMEPEYHDGDCVYVKYTDAADDGADVICSTADGAVIKRKKGNKLFSLNKALPFGEKSEDDFVKIEGVILGVVDPKDFATKEETAELEDLLADQVREFQRRNR